MRYSVYVWDQRSCARHARDAELGERVDCGCCYERWVGEHDDLPSAKALLAKEAAQCSEHCGYVTDEENEGEVIFTV